MSFVQKNLAISKGSPKSSIPSKYFALFFVILVGFSCHRGPVKLVSHVANQPILTPPDYSRAEAWAALPTKHDPADSIPRNAPETVKDGQATAIADVFFVHPTIYTGKPQGPSEWNADVQDADMNQKVDYSTILNQASTFNGAGRIYAPRYRQAHYSAFTTKDTTDKRQALDLAYQDVRAAFMYYLDHYAKNPDGSFRPIIIAAHSQGTIHCGRLLKEFFDEKPLQQRLVAAYLVGIATPPTYFKTILPGETATQTGCFVSWNTFARDFMPPYYNNGLHRALCTNPLLWNSTDSLAPRSLNRGGVGPKFRFYPEMVDAQNHQNLLWIGTPNVPGAALVKTKIWHVADINFFWMNIRENALQRVQAFVAKNPTKP
jgi:hypothetical protein